MKLEAVNIQNFRSIQEVTLEECGSFNVIVGKNNAGKSNILLAIDTIFKFLKQTKRNDFRSGTIVGIPIDFHRIDFHQNLVETPIKITMFFQLSPDERNNLIKEHVKDSVDLLDEPNKPALQLSLALVVKAYASEFLLEESASLFAYVETMMLCKSGCSTIQEDSIVCTIFNVNFIEQEIFIPDYIFNLIKQIGETNVLYLTERRKPLGKREAAQLLDLKITRKSREKFRAIQEIITALLGVEIDPVRANNTNSGEDPGAELDVDQFLVQINGAGIREALRLILDYELNQPNILLVEEPEIHLHPALETSMMRYLKSIGKNCQVFITTHSTNFLDTTEMKNVYLASREGSTNIQLINNVEEAEESIPRELGIRLSSLFMFDRLVFVEGPTDEYVIREWASICGVNLAQASVGIIPMGGVRSLPNFATEATINFLGKRRVSIFFMIDRDEREEAEINNFYERFGDKLSNI
jgi:predicted ATP-dependent endonuclease of OLD family